MKIVAACKRYANSMLSADNAEIFETDEEPSSDFEERIEMRRQESERSIDLQLSQLERELEIEEFDTEERQLPRIEMIKVKSNESMENAR